MAEWLFEDGIGERRAVLVDGGRIVRAEVERDGDGPPVGSVLPARLGARDAARRRAAVRLDNGSHAWLSPVPAGLSEGSALMVRLVRMALPEHGRDKLALVQPAEGPPALGPDLHARLVATGVSVRTVFPGAQHDALEEAGLSDLTEAARTGIWTFAGGALAIAITPAMTIIDVDGELPAIALAEAGAVAATAAIRALGISGSIGIDFPTLGGRADRLRIDARIAEGLAELKHERTAMNGFGFVQIVARRERPSLLERFQLDPVRSDALALLRLAERAVGTGALTLTARPAVAAQLDGEPQWLDLLARRTGRSVEVVADPAVKGIGHAQ